MSSNETAGSDPDPDGSRAHWEAIYRTSDYTEEMNPRYLGVLDRALEFLGDLEGRRLLDLGCGKGATAIWFAGKGARVTAVDGSAEAIRFLENRIREEGIADVIPVHCDAMEIDSLGPFDLVFGAMILHHLEPFDRFARVLADSMASGGRAFFWENNGMSDLLLWCREHLVGRFGIPKYGDDEEFPLTPSEVARLREHFAVETDFPEMLFFRMIPVYLLRGHFHAPFQWLDLFCHDRGWLRSLSYRQDLKLLKP